MTKKSMVQVAIGGKVLTMGGADDETHIQRIASCVNHVLQEFEDKDEYRCLPADLKPVLIHINIAEELIKALEAGEEVEKLNYVDEEIFAHDDTVKSVKATNSLDEEKDFDVTPLTQDILDKRAY